MKQDRFASVALLIVSSVVAGEGLRLPYVVNSIPGPGFFPLWIGIVMAFLSALLFLTTRAPNRAFGEGLAGLRRVGLVAGSFLLYIALMGYLGLLLSLTLLVAFVLRFVEEKSWRASLGASLLIAVNCYLLFKAWLGVPLPKGPLGI